MSKTKPNIWLMKTEPTVFSFDDLMQAPQQTTAWEGVRNYRARNYMRDKFQIGDQVLFYHSRLAEPAIVGLAEVVKAGYPDPSALDSQNRYFDAVSRKLGESRWVMVDIKAKKKWSTPVTLGQLRLIPELTDMVLLKKGMRLSIQPVSEQEFKAICQLAQD